MSDVRALPTDALGAERVDLAEVATTHWAFVYPERLVAGPPGRPSGDRRAGAGRRRPAPRPPGRPGEGPARGARAPGRGGARRGRAGAARRGLEPVLNVSFTTPFVPLREAMLGLFDDVVLSLHTVVRTPA